MTENSNEREFNVKEMLDLAESARAAREQEIAWCENVSDNLAALITIVTDLTEMDREEYKALVLRIRSQRDQFNAELRDQAAGQAAEPR